MKRPTREDVKSTQIETEEDERDKNETGENEQEGEGTQRHRRSGADGEEMERASCGLLPPSSAQGPSPPGEEALGRASSAVSSLL